MIGINKKNGAGFTLVELLIVVLIFSVIVGAATGVFARSLKIQRYNLAHQQLLNQTSYLMEYMSRSLRMAREIKNTSSSSIAFDNYAGESWEFSLTSGGKLIVTKWNDTPFDLISSDFKVTNFNVTRDGNKVKIILEIEQAGGALTDKPKIKMQTTVTKRNLETN